MLDSLWNMVLSLGMNFFLQVQPMKETYVLLRPGLNSGPLALPEAWETFQQWSQF